MITSGGTTTLGLYDNASEIRKKADITYVDSRVGDFQAQVASVAGGHKAYQTLALAQASQSSLPANTVVEVTNDPTSSNNGIYQWNGTTLTKSAYDPLTQAKDYTDQALTFINGSYFSIVGFINPSDGSLTSHSDYRCTDFIPVVPSTKYTLKTKMAESRPTIAYYDKNKVFIGADGVAQTTLSEVDYTIPSNAYHIRAVGNPKYGPTVNDFYIKSKNYSIFQIDKILQGGGVAMPAKQVLIGSSNVEILLNALISDQNSILNTLDLNDDKLQPFFINIPEFVKSSITPTNYDTVTVTARNNDRALTVSDATAFAVGSACTIYDSTADTYTSHVVTGISSNQVTFASNVPTNPISIQTMHDATNGQHLNPYGYRGFADYIIEQIQRYSYRKKENLLFDFHPYKHKTILWNNPNLYDYNTGTTKLIDVATSNVTFGGFVAGTTNLARTCGAARQGSNTYANTQYFGIAYELKQATQGASISMTAQAGRKSGFIHIPISCEARPYVSSVDSSNQFTNGRVRLRVLNGTNEIHNEIYDIGMVHHAYVDFENAQTLTIEMSLADAVPTVALLHGVYVYRKASTTSRDKFFKDGDVIAFHGDSWTQYPIASTVGESGQVRPDGSTSTGAQYLSRRMKDKLASQGINVTTLNMGFGGQTSEWGKYWIQNTIKLNPTHVVICFSINDYNSQSVTTGYDINPENQWANLPVADGGVNGRVLTVEKWLNNIKWMCDKFIEAGVKPIVILPPQTASFSKTDGMRSGMLQTIIEGF